MKLGKFSNLLALTYTDTMNVHRYTPKINDDGTTNIGISELPVYSNVKCRISFNQNDNSEYGKEDSNPIRLGIKVFCSPDVDIQKGDMLKVKRLDDNNLAIAEYEGIANLPLKYVTHQEVLILEEGDA